MTLQTRIEEILVDFALHDRSGEDRLDRVENKQKALTAILEAFKERLPKEKGTNPTCDVIGWLEERQGWNSYRQELLKILGGDDEKGD